MKVVISGDQHIRHEIPICRRESPDEWKKFQYDRLVEIVSIANQYSADICFTGDTFDSPHVSTEMVSLLIRALEQLHGTASFLAGNHEMAYRREANVDTASIGIIKAIAGDNTGKIRYYVANENTDGGRFEHSHRLNDEITMVHTLSFKDEDSIPFGCQGVTADYLFDKYDTPFIAVGDNHQNFHVEKNGRHVISSGTMVIQTANEFDYTPTVYFVDTEKEIVEPILLSNPIEMLTRDHLTARLEKDARIAEAIEVLRKDGDRVSLSFMTNLLSYLEGKELPKGTEDILDELKEGVRNGTS